MSTHKHTDTCNVNIQTFNFYINFYIKNIDKHTNQEYFFYLSKTKQKHNWPLQDTNNYTYFSQ